MGVISTVYLPLFSFQSLLFPSLCFLHQLKKHNTRYTTLNNNYSNNNMFSGF